MMSRTLSKIEKVRRKHHFNLRSIHAEYCDAPIETEIIFANEVQIKNAHMALPLWRKICHLAALNDEHPLHFMQILLNEAVEASLANEQELGDMIRRRILEEAHDVSDLSPGEREERLRQIRGEA